jgi:hypothetical protein
VSLWVFEKVDRIPVQITVEDRDYLQLSRFEIGGGKRIYQHLSGRAARPCAKPSFRLRDFSGVVKKVGENLIFAASPIEVRV